MRILTGLLATLLAVTPATADMRPYNDVKLVNGWHGNEWYEDDGTFQFCNIYQDTELTTGGEKMRWSWALGDDFYAMKIEHSESWDRQWLKAIVTYTMPHLTGALKTNATINIDAKFALTDVTALVFNEQSIMFDLDFKPEQRAKLTENLTLANQLKMTIYDGSPRAGWISFTVGMLGSAVAFKWLNACYAKQKGLTK